ncbi:hypothetical protein TNIN_353441 [Trichonephila inaurata madagascariensis]|uniref:Uncharacterized protein n=1 Tax=Trichonephila inaurata madagascariensis TaxID=2747483 RepID=A0A8X6X8A3_9ARAC|nr:hypothetical protein TNIN_353441 [Trichonephila inaurata madagascariensis]
MDNLKSLRIKLSDIRNEYYEVVENDSDLEPLKLEMMIAEISSSEWIYAKIRGVVLIVLSGTIHFCVEILREMWIDSQRSPESKTMQNMESKNTTINVNNECFQPKQTIPYVESFETERGICEAF